MFLVHTAVLDSFDAIMHAGRYTVKDFGTWNMGVVRRKGSRDGERDRRDTSNTKALISIIDVQFHLQS